MLTPTPSARMLSEPASTPVIDHEPNITTFRYLGILRRVELGFNAYLIWTLVMPNGPGGWADLQSCENVGITALLVSGALGHRPGVPRKPGPRAREVMQFAAANIRRLRTRAALTQEGLASASGLDVTYVARVERATINLSIGVLAQIADALGVEPGRLLRPARMHAIAMGRPRKAPFR